MVLDLSTLYQNLPRNLERLMDEVWNPLEFSQRRQAYPPLNIVEDTENITIHAIVPGVEKEDIDLTFSENSLILKGEKKPEQGQYFRQERPTGPFQRVVNLNISVDRDKILARIKDGVLTISLPKSEEQKPHKIKIESE